MLNEQLKTKQDRHPTHREPTEPGLPENQSIVREKEGVPIVAQW